jgi:uncharacterized phage protein (TIGR01671 family)
MRLKKFRAWYDNSQTWVYFTIGETWTELEKEVYEQLCLDGKEFYQFTGLTDKNGKEIYEGDIVIGIEYSPFNFNANLEETKGEIVFDEILFGYCITDGNKPISHMDEIRIFGNIHQNPELLNIK